MRSTMFQTKQSLPVSKSAIEDPQSGLIRRRLSSLSLNLKINQSAISSSFRRTKSVSSMGEYAGDSIKKWWSWGWSWILSRKPVFAVDLEMNEEESAVLGSHSKGSLRHVFYKVTSQIRRKLGGADSVGLPQSYRYDSCDYSKNFDRVR